MSCFVSLSRALHARLDIRTRRLSAIASNETHVGTNRTAAGARLFGSTARFSVAFATNTNSSARSLERRRLCARAAGSPYRDERRWHQPARCSTSHGGDNHGGIAALSSVETCSLPVQQLLAPPHVERHQERLLGQRQGACVVRRERALLHGHRLPLRPRFRLGARRTILGWYGGRSLSWRLPSTRFQIERPTQLLSERKKVQNPFPRHSRPPPSEGEDSLRSARRFSRGSMQGGQPVRLSRDGGRRGGERRGFRARGFQIFCKRQNQVFQHLVALRGRESNAHARRRPLARARGRADFQSHRAGQRVGARFGLGSLRSHRQLVRIPHYKNSLQRNLRLALRPAARARPPTRLRKGQPFDARLRRSLRRRLLFERAAFWEDVLADRMGGCLRRNRLVVGQGDAAAAGNAPPLRRGDSVHRRSFGETRYEV